MLEIILICFNKDIFGIVIVIGVIIYLSFKKYIIIYYGLFGFCRNNICVFWFLKVVMIFDILVKIFLIYYFVWYNVV